MPACSLPHSRPTLNLLPYPLTSCLPHTTRCMVLNCPADPHMNLHSSRAHQRVQPLPGCNHLEEALATAFSLGMCQWLRRCVYTYTYIQKCLTHLAGVRLLSNLRQLSKERSPLSLPNTKDAHQQEVPVWINSL